MLMQYNGPTLDAVWTKQRQIIIDVLLFITCQVQERAIFSTQVAHFIFIKCSCNLVWHSISMINVFKKVFTFND